MSLLILMIGKLIFFGEWLGVEDVSMQGGEALFCK